MKTAMVRCSKCGKLYNAEEGPCPTCYRPDDIQRFERRMDGENRKRMTRVFLIFMGIVLLIPAISLSIAYFTRGWQRMTDGLSSYLLLAEIFGPWLFMFSSVMILALEKGKAALWLLLTILIPISPLYSIPHLLIQRPRGSEMGWGNLLLGSLILPTAVIGMLIAFLVWMH